MNNIVVATSKSHLQTLIDHAIQAKGLACDLNHIDVSQITDMSFLFDESLFKGDMRDWDVSNVTDMRGMFSSARFNGNISAWNTSKVEDMSYMFYTSNFNSTVSDWNVERVKKMHFMFCGSDFNSDVSLWNVANVKHMDFMFSNSPFRGDLSRWSISSDVVLSLFIPAEKMEEFIVPNVYHWFFALTEPSCIPVWPQAWQDHFSSLASMARGITATQMEAALLMQTQWLQRVHVPYLEFDSTLAL